MLRQARFFILVCLLIAITINCIQATYISFSQAASSECVVSEAPNGEQAMDSAFIVSDDGNKIGSLPNLNLLHLRRPPF